MIKLLLDIYANKICFQKRIKKNKKQNIEQENDGCYVLIKKFTSFTTAL